MPSPNASALESWYVTFLRALGVEASIFVPMEQSSQILHTSSAETRESGIDKVNKLFGNEKPFNLKDLLEQPGDTPEIKEQKRQKKEKIQTLAETGNLLIDTQNKAKDANVHCVVTSKPDGMAVITPLTGEHFPDLSPLVANPQELWKAESMHNHLAQLEGRGLNDVQKTITDIFPGASMDEILKSGWIVKSNGEPYEFKEENPYANYTKLMDAVNSEEGVLFQDKPNKKSVHVKREENGTIKKTPRDSLIINPKLRKEIINNLELISGLMDALPDKKNPDLKAFKDECRKTLKNIKKTTLKKDIDKEIDKLSKISDKYMIDNIGVKTNKVRANRMDAGYKIRNIKECLEEEKLLSEKKPDNVKAMKERVAANLVKAYATMCANHSDDPKKQELGNKLLNDTDAFNKKLQETMKDASFDYLYGGNNKESMGRLRDALAAKGGALLKTYAEEVKHPTPERKAHEQFMKATKPHDRMQTYNKGPVSPQMRDELTQTLTALNNRMQNVGTSLSGRNSPEFEALKDELMVANIRLQSGAKYIDYRRMMAQVADKADKYFDSKIGKDLNGKGAERLEIATEIRNLADGVDRNILPSKNLNATSDPKMQTLASRVINSAAVKMTEDQNMSVQRKGKEIINNPKKFQAQVDKLMQSEAFKSIYKDHPEQLKEDMTKDPQDLLEKLVKAEAKLNPEKATAKSLTINENKSELIKQKDEARKAASAALAM